MKKILFTIFATTVALVALSADVIITTKSEKLEVKIMEISSSEVKYKKINNLQGPTFVLNTSEINTIMYENGEVQVIEHKATQPTAAPQTSYNNQPMQYPQTYNNGYNNGYNYGTNNRMPYPGTPGYAGPGIIRDGRHYYFNGQQIVLQDFLYQTCPVAYDYWRKNFVIECVGCGLLAGGATLVCLTSWNLWPLAVVGGAFVCAGVPMVCVGNIRRCKKAPEMFNQRCASQFSDIKINLQASQNGIGLALTF